MKTPFHLKKPSPIQIVIFGFAALILLGAALLMLPFSTLDGCGASFDDALFTATSAVCVTGLVVQDTATYWSSFGQAVLLILIQIGGLGVVTVAAGFTLLSGRRINLKGRTMMQDALSAPQMGGIVKLTRKILLLTFGFELCGAALLTPVFCREFGFGSGLWRALFHSVSAFCNAGFDLMGSRGAFSSFTSLAFDPLLNTVIMLLIVIGGIGFFTWEDLLQNRLHFHRYRMQTKVILITSGALILSAALYFYFFEFSHLDPASRVLPALFQSVTARTAGFNTADLASMSEPGQLVFIFLMLVGGSPGSTAGGMKTTTLALLIACVISALRNSEDVHLFSRRIAVASIRHACAILSLYLLLFASAGLVISRVEGLPLLTCLFETASAVGTVGVTLGITPALGALSRVLLIALMFFGRIGALSLLLAFFSDSHYTLSHLPQEKITIG